MLIFQVKLIQWPYAISTCIKKTQITIWCLVSSSLRPSAAVVRDVKDLVFSELLSLEWSRGSGFLKCICTFQ